MTAPRPRATALARRDPIGAVLLGLAIAVVPFAVLSDPAPWPWSALLVGAVAVLGLGTWLAWPLPLVGLLVLAGTAATQLSGGLEPALFLLSVLALVLTGSERPGAATWAVTLLVLLTPLLLSWLVPDTDFSPWIWMLGIAFPAAMGWAVSRQDQLNRELTAARHELAEHAVREERRRIARDVHDLVGHGLAATLVQVSSARHVLRRDPEAADQALGIAEKVGRASMQELRSTLAVLREGPEPEQALPGAAELPGLVQAAGEHGLDASLTVRGAWGDLDPVTGLTLYRIAQEALTNASRHAPAARTEVLLDTEGDVVVLEVVSRGAGGAASSTGPPRSRYGLLGMRERAEVLGGSLEAGPVGADWVVSCRVPLGSSRGTGT